MATSSTSQTAGSGAKGTVQLGPDPVRLLPTAAPNTRVPFRVLWREFCVRALPSLWFGIALLGVATLWPSSQQVSKHFWTTAKNRQPTHFRLPAEHLASQPTVITNSEGEFSLMRLQ